MAILHFVDKRETNNNIKQALLNQGYETTRIQRFHKNGQPLRTILVWCIDEQTTTKLIDSNGVSIGWTIIEAVEYQPQNQKERVMRCAVCSRLGHTQKWCRDSRRCGICMGPHYNKSCPYHNNPRRHRCINCKGKRQPHHHSSMSVTCPILHERYPWYKEQTRAIQQHDPSTPTTTTLTTSTSTHNAWTHHQGFRQPRTYQPTRPLQPAQIPTKTIMQSPTTTNTEQPTTNTNTQSQSTTFQPISPIQPISTNPSAAFLPAPDFQLPKSNISRQNPPLQYQPPTDTHVTLQTISQQFQLMQRTNTTLLKQIEQQNTKFEQMQQEQLQLQKQILHLQKIQTAASTSIVQLAHAIIRTIDQPNDTSIKDELKTIIQRIAKIYEPQQQPILLQNPAQMHTSEQQTTTQRTLRSSTINTTNTFQSTDISNRGPPTEKLDDVDITSTDDTKQKANDLQ